ncbi:MAG: homoserine dehydrogenase [Thermoguttaceae bacterium]
MKSNMNDVVNVALLGFGTIGAGVAQILLDKKDQIKRATGKEVRLVKIVDKDVKTDRGLDLPAGILTDDAESIFCDPSISLGIELIGGLEPARSFVLRFLNENKDVVTANKALLANHGTELFETARQKGRTIAFEAAVCGGIPILTALQTALQANSFLSIHGILNGTSNFILSQMESGSISYQDAVAAAQKLGYAEANPAMDVDGTDAAQKLSILSQIAFRKSCDWKQFDRMGIEFVEAIDFKYAKKLGYRIKLLAVVKQNKDGLEFSVSPTLIRTDSPLARVRDAFNAVSVVGDSVGPLFFQGLGAGRHPTASAVVGDVIDTILGRTAITFRTLNLWNPQTECDFPICKIEDSLAKYYLRFSAEDRPGVMHEITGILGDRQISIASLLQYESKKNLANNGVNDSTHLILTTHEVRSGNLIDAIAALEKLPCLRSKIIRMRVQ